MPWDGARYLPINPFIRAAAAAAAASATVARQPRGVVRIVSICLVMWGGVSLTCAARAHAYVRITKSCILFSHTYVLQPHSPPPTAEHTFPLGDSAGGLTHKPAPYRDPSHFHLYSIRAAILPANPLWPIAGKGSAFTGTVSKGIGSHNSIWWRLDFLCSLFQAYFARV